MEPLPASYYGKIDKKNPVISAFDGEIKEFKSCIKRIRDSPKFHQNTYVRGSKMLFEIWNKYKPRLPTYYFDQHVLQIADFLYSNKLYHLAQWQGYGRYLCEHGEMTIDNIKDVDHLKSALFPQGFNTDQAKLTFRALQGQCLCMFYLEKGRGREPSLDSIQKLLSVLGFLRIVMQAVLPQESLCWLIYNGSLYIYDICRFLMTVSRSSQALEFLLWACVCLEMSIPLQSPCFLPWRATLYCAVCQCYYEGQAGVHAEVFARRALGKVSELANLERPEDAPLSKEDQKAFKEATIKLAIMVFKRSVYEPRRKPKSSFRPKTKNCLKDISNVPWPRNHTERILVELFEGNAAQFLAVLEALWDSTRRPLQTGGPDEPDIMDVALELMSAGVSLLSGVGGSTELQRNENLPVCLNGISPDSSLLDVAIAGGNTISVDAALKFVKLLFRYEQWDMFKYLANSLSSVLAAQEGPEMRRSEMELSLLIAVELMLAAQRSRHLYKDSGVDNTLEKDRLQGSMGMSQELMDLFEVLYTSVCESTKDVEPDGDLVMDLILLLWNKCKHAFQKAQVRHWDPARHLGKMESQDKWVKALFLLSDVSEAFNLAEIDPVVVAEMTLRLALVLENSADTTLNTGTASATTEDSSLESTPVEKHCVSTSPVKLPAEQQLQLLCDVLERGLEAVCDGNTRQLPADGSSICDMAFMQWFLGSPGDGPEGMKSSQTFTLSSDLHVELLVFLHRAALKLALHKNLPESVVVEKIRKNKVSRALYLTQRALLQHKTNQSCTRKLLEEASSLVEKAEVEERRLYLTCTAAKNRRQDAAEGCGVPPPPILLSRTNHTMTFTLASFGLEKQVCWYQMLGREADGINLKVRLGDCHLLGTGVMVPVKGERLFRIEGLEHNQTYIFAVAAYDAQGKMVGQSIGDSTKPLLASAPLSLLMAWAHLAQTAYQTGHSALVKKACNKLWGHFTRPPPENTSTCPQQEGLAQTRLCVELLHLTSPLLHRLFFSSILMQTEIHIQEGALFCDSLCDQGPPIWGQKARLAECERMLVALDMALWLNDNSTALQAVVGCYGLLAPLIYHQIPSGDVLQILIKCLMVLQEISGVVKKKRNIETTESLQHMVACMTYYVVKGLRLQKETGMANAILEQGKKLLMEITDRSLLGDDSKKAAGNHGDDEMADILRSLDCMKLKKQQTSSPAQESALPWNRGVNVHDLTGHEDPAVLYSVIETQNIKTAFKDVMKFKRKPGFMEFVVLMLQKALQEDQLELVVQWGQEALHWLSRRDEELVIKKAQVMVSETRKHPTSSADPYKSFSKPRGSVGEKKERDMLQKKRMFALKAQKSERECKVVDVLLYHLTLLVRRLQHRRRLRLICSEEWVWRCHVNLIIARAHLTLMHRSLSQQSSAPHLSYSQLPWAWFSLPHCGSLVRWRNGPQHTPSPDPYGTNIPTTGIRATNQHQHPSPKGSPPKGSLPKATARQKNRRASSGEDTAVGESDPDSEYDGFHVGSDASAQLTTLSSPHQRSLDVLSKAALHLRRAMVLSHRGGHWTSLQSACGMLWDQVCTLPPLLQGRSTESPPGPNQNPSVSLSLNLDQVYSILTPLLTVACELLMDMMDKLQLWKVYSEDEQDVESSLHFSHTLDDGTRVDLRWLKTLVLSTLELLYYQTKWETLAHLALTFNFYTRERYTHTVTPLLVYAQRRLLERIAAFGGPPAPQPHHTQTTQITAEKISCRNYVSTQITCVWTVKTRVSGRQGSIITAETSQMKQAMSLVSVPLDVEDTLRCFRESLEKGNHTLLSFQHSHTLLMLLLAHTQPSLEVPFCKGMSALHTPGRVEFSGMVYTPPSISPPDLSAEDFSSLGSICLCPLPPSQTQLVQSSLNSSAKLLQANNLSSLRAQALHDLGNLHFYKGNRRAAHSFWAKALDCSLQGSGVLEAWDGSSWEGLSPQQILKQAGIWGCLQGAVLTAKIAQYVLTSDIGQRTKCCLLSAHLFKSLLQASLPHPQANLQYVSYSVEGDLIPGLDLFGDPQRGSLSATVSSLGFLCHWLYTTGHHITVLPLLCLYLYVVGRVCKDPQLTVRGRILKVRALAELGMFSQAFREVSRLVNADNVPLPHSYSSPGEKAGVRHTHTHAHTHTHKHTQIRTHTDVHIRTHMRIHTHTNIYALSSCCLQ